MTTSVEAAIKKASESIDRLETASHLPTADAVYAALWANDLLRSLEYGQITATGEGSKVILRGHVTSARTRQWAEQITRGVSGVEAVENHLVDDDTLVRQVCLALARDHRTAGEIIHVAARHGIIVLSGTVTGTSARDTAEERAASVAQVRGVSNYIEAPGVVVRPETEQVLQPRIGEEVIATDMVVGRVAFVIVNPHNRRVTGLVVRGELPDLAFDGRFWDSYDVTELDSPITTRERWVVIPRQDIAELTPTAVWLRLSGPEAARHHDFDPAFFGRLPEGWQPPYPYEPGDVWLSSASRPDLQGNDAHPGKSHRNASRRAIADSGAEREAAV